LPDQYQITRQIAWGGCGQIFEGYDRVRGRAVIVEVRPARYMRDDLRPPLAEILTSIRHPSLQAILEIVLRGELLFVIIDSVGNCKDLRELLRAGPLKSDMAARVVAEIAEAAQVLIEHGVVPRDINPQGIVVSAEGRAILTDLSSHVFLREDDGVPGRILETPAYMAPELLLPSSGGHDVRSTVYSLGATLYELLTGGPPYCGRSATETIQHVSKGNLRRPRRVQRSVPKPLESICLKAMARSPEDRHATPGELAAELRRFLSTQPERRRSFWKRS
jgi:serine/threonine protein kinase